MPLLLSLFLFYLFIFGLFVCDPLNLIKVVGMSMHGKLLVGVWAITNGWTTKENDFPSPQELLTNRNEMPLSCLQTLPNIPWGQPCTLC